MKRWRIAENKWNLRDPPWRDAVGIEEVDDDVAVPGLICWFTRPNGLTTAQHVVAMHNALVNMLDSST